ncbi:uncharacterized protein K452DRAFT_293470 [Aplosporella prunicola CBS 121167]|uniref:Uncharacterized protein n=1 Tax=Aplosporella prunicola CBS 121167 TaxID=1176127 RepID=A0A6A6AVT9_9PEZI|nr:uncharacterized protein K452DRAFT_293470 [Aplosporella prunicola CBS 121167]KAF2135085.1 hypothetical protein K452DRAFT_293470 [Aplosporella prunicola CBS 121167]
MNSGNSSGSNPGGYPNTGGGNYPGGPGGNPGGGHHVLAAGSQNNHHNRDYFNTILSDNPSSSNSGPPLGDNNQGVGQTHPTAAGDGVVQSSPLNYPTEGNVAETGRWLEKYKSECVPANRDRVRWSELFKHCKTIDPNGSTPLNQIMLTIEHHIISKHVPVPLFRDFVRANTFITDELIESMKKSSN